MPTPLEISFKLVSSTGNTIIWCDSPSCSEFSWTLTVSDKFLQLTVLLSPPIVHLNMTLTRVSYNATVFPFDGLAPICFPAPNTHSNTDCPYISLLNMKKLTEPRITPKHLLAYDHCYQINDEVEYRIYWSLNLPDMVSVAISIPTNNGNAQWIAVGFGSTFPGMNTSDIVLGYITSTGTQCVRSMTAVKMVGTPIDTNTVQLQNTSMTYSNGILSLQFTRKLAEGSRPIVINPSLYSFYSLIWAIGPNDQTTCTGSPSYHAHTRGYRVINFMYPEKVFDNYRLCN